MPASSCAGAPTAATAGSRRCSCRVRASDPAGSTRKLFETRDRLAEFEPDAALLDRRLRVADDALVTQVTRFAGHVEARDFDLAARTRAAVLGRLDPPTARLIRELDGSRTLGEALAEVVEDADMEKAGLDIARRMVEVGFLELAD